MSAQLITANVWNELTKAARENQKPAYVAVAYFGRDAANRLRLPAESQLVVDASEGTVKSGQTHPADLRRMHRRGIAVYSAENLHAKVFVFDQALFVGSTNVSDRSANVLQEAIIRITDTAVVAAARRFVKGLCVERLGPEELKRLQRLYRPSRFVQGKNTRGYQKKFRLSQLRVALISDVDVPDKLVRAFRAGRNEAAKKREHGRGFHIEEFYWSSPAPFREGQQLIQVFRTAHGRIVSPPGHVIHMRQYRDGKMRKTLVYVELPSYDWEPFSRFSKGSKAILSRSGIKSQSAAKTISAFWNERRRRTR
jgi:hypothetical protein